MDRKPCDISSIFYPMLSPLKLLLVAGARPNFMKIAPLIHAIRANNAACNGSGRPIDFRLVHTGQHYDAKMSGVFFQELGIPAPDHDLEVGSGSHAAQTANIMLAFEPVCMSEKPDWVVVVGDVNSTLARTALGHLTPADVYNNDPTHTDPGIALPIPANFVESIFLPLALDVFFSKPSITNYDIAGLRNQDAPNLIHQQAQLALTLLQNMRPQGNKPVRMKPAWSAGRY